MFPLKKIARNGGALSKQVLTHWSLEGSPNDEQISIGSVNGLLPQRRQPVYNSVLLLLFRALSGVQIMSYCEDYSSLLCSLHTAFFWLFIFTSQTY